MAFYRVTREEEITWGHPQTTFLMVEERGTKKGARKKEVSRKKLTV